MSKSNVEHVARALCKVDGTDPDEPCFGIEGEAPQWVLYKQSAVAAINALREYDKANA